MISNGFWRRHHQEPGGQPECGNVMELHSPFLSDFTRKRSDVRPIQREACRLDKPAR